MMSNLLRGVLTRLLAVLLLLGAAAGVASAINPILARRISGNPYPNIGALFVAANSQFASLTNMTSLQVGNTDDFTICGWVNQTATGITNGGTLVAKGDAGNNSEYFVFYNQGVGWRFRVYSTASSVSVTSATGVRTAGAWDFVVAWHDQAANTINITVNDSAVSSISKGAVSITASTGSFRMGCTGTGGSNSTFYDGTIDSVGFWKGRILSAADRTQLYKGGVGMAYRDLDGGLKTNLSTYWNLDGNFIDANGVAVPMTNNAGVSFAAGKR